MGQAASISSAVGRKSQLTSPHSQGFFLLSGICLSWAACSQQWLQSLQTWGAQSSVLLPVECSSRSSVLLPVECSSRSSVLLPVECSYRSSVLLPKLSAPTCGVLLPKLSAAYLPQLQVSSLWRSAVLSRACGSYLIYIHRLCSTVRPPLQPPPSCQIPSLEVLSPGVPFPSQ